MLGGEAVLDSFEVAVVEVGGDGGEDGFDAPAAVLAGVVVVFAGDGEEVFDAVEDVGEADRFDGEGGDEVFENSFLEGGVVGEDGAGVF